MIRLKSKKTNEGLYTPVVPPTSLAATTRLDEDFQNFNVKNYKLNEKTDCNLTRRKKFKGKSSSDKKEHKTLVNEETALGTCKKFEQDLKNQYSEENAKEDDAEEFFMMIKETVTRAVEKTIHDKIDQSLRDLNSKLEDIQQQLQNHTNSLEKIPAEITNKVSHYGEENSRHFRYLCMKSEYDKMFYQHQNIITAVPLDGRPNILNSFPQHLPPNVETQEINQTKISQQPIPSHTVLCSKLLKKSNQTIECNCKGNDLGDFDGDPRSKLSISSKSSDMGIREVKDLLEQLQKFYDQQNHQKPEQMVRNNVNEKLNIPDQNDSADADEDDESSDDMSIEENLRNSGDS